MRITKEILWLAQKRIEDDPIFKNSIRGKEANLIGSIGEVLFERFIQEEGLTLEKETREEERYNHDFIVDEEFRVEVKTKDRSVVPKSYYDCSVTEESLSRQDPDFFYFISLLRKRGIFTDGYLLGAIDTPNLYIRGEKWKAGEIDARNGKTISKDCVNIEIKNLIGNDEFINKVTGADGWIR